jgi:CheY-like chemotaxis protein
MSATERYRSGADVRRLQPLRVVLSGGDRRFVRVTSFLLGRRGYDVVNATPAETVKAAERHRADVVVIETSDSRLSAARKVAALYALSTTPGVLVVVDDSDDRWESLPTIRKWTPLDELVHEIEAASMSRGVPPGRAEDVRP